MYLSLHQQTITHSTECACCCHIQATFFPGFDVLSFLTVIYVRKRKEASVRRPVKFCDGPGSYVFTIISPITTWWDLHCIQHYYLIIILTGELNKTHFYWQLKIHFIHLLIYKHSGLIWIFLYRFANTQNYFTDPKYLYQNKTQLWLINTSRY